MGVKGKLEVERLEVKKVGVGEDFCCAACEGVICPSIRPQ